MTDRKSKKKKVFWLTFNDPHGVFDYKDVMATNEKEALEAGYAMARELSEKLSKELNKPSKIECIGASEYKPRYY